MIYPWIGDFWEMPSKSFGGVKVLILGESAHNDEYYGKSPTDYLTSCVKWYLEGKASRFHAVITTLLVGKNAHASVSSDEKECLWQTIAYYNYIPKLIAGPRDSIPNEYITEARPYFEIILKKHEPKAIIVCGNRAWEWILSHSDTEDGEIVMVQGAFATKIKHPSSGFSYIGERPKVDTLLERTRKHLGISMLGLH